MPALRPRFRALAVGIAAFSLVSVAAGGTLAASTNPPTLYACFNTSGQVSMATVPQCKLPGGGQLAYWGTQGVPGPTGAAGATGPTGATGATGAPGAGSATNIVNTPDDSQFHPLWSGPGLTIQLKCDGGNSEINAAVPQGTVDASYTYVGINGVAAGSGSGSGPAGPSIGVGFTFWVDFSASDGTTAVHFNIHRRFNTPAGTCSYFVTG